MKNLFSILIFMSLVLSQSLLVAQDPATFTGMIDYDMIVEGGELSAAERAQAESTISMLIGDGYMKKTTQNIMANSTEILMPDSVVIIFDQMGQQFAFGLGPDFIQANDSAQDAAWNEVKDKISYEFLNESKEVAGVNCKKAVYELDGNYYDVFYTDEYIFDEKVGNDVNLRGIKGVALEYSIPLPGQDGASVKVTAKKFKFKKKVSPKKFAVPSGIEVQTGEQLRKMMGM